MADIDNPLAQLPNVSVKYSAADPSSSKILIDGKELKGVTGINISIDSNRQFADVELRLLATVVEADIQGRTHFSRPIVDRTGAERGASGPPTPTPSPATSATPQPAADSGAGAGIPVTSAAPGELKVDIAATDPSQPARGTIRLQDDLRTPGNTGAFGEPLTPKER